MDLIRCFIPATNNCPFVSVPLNIDHWADNAKFGLDRFLYEITV